MLQLKASADYGLRMVLYLAMEQKVCSSKDISEGIAVPRDYLIQLAQLLRNAGIIDARAGKKGGYLLAKPSDQITFLEVLDAIDEGTRTPKEMAEIPSNLVNPALATDLRKMLCLALALYNACMSTITIKMLVDCIKDVGSVDLYLSERPSTGAHRLLDQEVVGTIISGEAC